MKSASGASNAVAWLISSIVSKSEILEAWATRVGLGENLARFKEDVVFLLREVAKIPNTNGVPSAGLLLLKDLQEIAYRSDDFLDEMDYCRIQDEIKQSARGDEGSTASSSSKFGHAINALFKWRRPTPMKFTLISGLADRMKYLSGQVQRTRNEIRSVLFLFQCNDISKLEIQPVESMQRMTSTFPPHCVFGRDWEREYLVTNLLTTRKADDIGPLSVFSVVGMGGVGKTTLTQLVYNDKRVQEVFDLRMWAYASSDFDISRVAHEILEQSYCRHVEIKSLDMYRTEIAKILKPRRFLLVVDDMWDGCYSQWNLLLDLLKSSSLRGSVILVTTRSQSVARMIRSSDIITLDGLKDDEIWNLLKSIIFNDDKWPSSHQNLEIIGRQIAERLKGNPLLAKSVGSTLRFHEMHEREWMRFLEAKEFTEGGRSIDALRLSYDYLPVNLQQSFSYCSLFPNNYPLDREDLVRLWIAQGFVVSKPNRRVEDVGREYFDALVDRSFLQRVGQENPNSEYLFEYRMHDLMYDLAKVVSADESVSLGSSENVVFFPPTVRHVSIVTERQRHFRKDFYTELVVLIRSLKIKNLRSFILVGKEDSTDPNILENLQGLIKEATGLRVLRLDVTSNVPSFFTKIKKCIHLRYLKLDLDFGPLPEDICRLYHLQVLDIGRSKLDGLPTNFNNLVNLRHFVAEKRVHSMIAGVSKLTSLQELREFRIKRNKPFGIEQLKNLNNLRGSLSICNLMNLRSKEEASEARLVEKEFLNSLSLTWDSVGLKLLKLKSQEVVLEGLQPHKNIKSIHIIGYGGGDNMVSWLHKNITTSLVNLESIYLEDCLKLETLPPLGELPFLRMLHLKFMHRVEEIGGRFYGENLEIGFQSLENMIIEDMPALKVWRWIDRPLLFPALHALEIKNCPELMLLPLSSPASIEAEEDQRFPLLNTLIINKCPKVERLPAFPHTHRLSKISIEETGSFGELFLSFSQGELKLEICSNQNIRALEEMIVFYNLTNLNSLSIKNCPNLSSLSWEGIYSLVWLNNLHIEECPSIFSLSQGNEGWPSHPSLSKLSTLEIVNCENLMSLPSDLHCLRSLKKLSINGCKLIESLPENGLPRTVEEFEVVNCSDELSELSQKYKRMMSEGKLSVE